MSLDAWRVGEGTPRSCAPPSSFFNRFTVHIRGSIQSYNILTMRHTFCFIVGARRALILGVLLMYTHRADSVQPLPQSFDGKISRQDLEFILSRAMTTMDLLIDTGHVDDNLRMLQNTGCRFAGRSIYLWGGESQLPQKLAAGKENEGKIHALMPELVIQAGIFEIVTTEVNALAMPPWVFEEFHLEPETRNFCYADMIYPDGTLVDHWNKGASVPDMSRLETRMWVYFVARSYIDIGVEALHMGQVALMNRRDLDLEHWWDVMSRIREYAKGSARRKIVLCDAHTPDGGPLYQKEHLLFDLHSFPLRIEEVPDRPQEGVLKVGYLDSLFKRSKGGITPSGWKCESLPFLVELDNFEPSGKEGQNIGGHWIWGYDEICWFAHQPEAYRNQWLGYADGWVRQNDPNAFFQMPGMRCLAVPVNGTIHGYRANRTSSACPDGFNQEDTIREIWNKETPG